MEKISVLILAGGLNRISLYPGYVPGYKAALRLAGRPSIHYVIEALTAVPELGEITVAGPCSVLGPLLPGIQAEGRVHLCPGGDDLASSLRCGLQQVPSTEPVLITTGDVPLLTPAAVRDFLSACRDTPRWGNPEAVFLAVVPRSAYTGDYARFTKPFNHFRDQAICHGNLAVVHPRLLENREVMERLQSLYALRKRPIASALATGLHIGLEFLLGVDTLHVLTLPHVAHTISEELRIDLVPVLIEHPEVTIDVDDADDYDFVLRQLQHTASGARGSAKQLVPRASAGRSPRRPESS